MGVDLYVANLAMYFQDALMSRFARTFGRGKRVYLTGQKPPWLGLEKPQARKVAERVRDRVAELTGVKWSESSDVCKHDSQLGNLEDAGVLQICARDWFKNREPEVRHLLAWPNAWVPGDFDQPMCIDLEKLGTFEVASAARLRRLLADLALALENPPPDFPEIDLIKDGSPHARANAAVAARTLIEAVTFCIDEKLPLVRD